MKFKNNPQPNPQPTQNRIQYNFFQNVLIESKESFDSFYKREWITFASFFKYFETEKSVSFYTKHKVL